MRAPDASIVIREYRDQPFYEAKWRYQGRQVKRRIGAAWLRRNGGVWEPQSGRVPHGSYDARRAHVRAAELVAEYVAEAANVEQVERKKRDRGVSFREVAHGYLEWLERVRGAKPSTLADHRWRLADSGPIMQALGDMPAAKITGDDVEALLGKIADGGGKPRTVNKHRATISAIYNYGIKAFKLASNPAAQTDKRREAAPGPLMYYSPEEVEALARALATGAWREKPIEYAAERADDRQDAELIRVAAYAGLRMGELLALRWRDVDFAGHALTISRAMSAGVEGSTKSGKVRRVPLPDQAAGALDRLGQRQNFTGPDELVFVNVYGRDINGSALRRRFKRARDAAGLRPLRFHDLRHTYGSLLAASGVDLVTIQAVMGHSAIQTTSRYLHAKPASEQAAVFTRAFEPATPPENSPRIAV